VHQVFETGGDGTEYATAADICAERERQIQICQAFSHPPLIASRHFKKLKSRSAAKYGSLNQESATINRYSTENQEGIFMTKNTGSMMVVSRVSSFESLPEVKDKRPKFSSDPEQDVADTVSVASSSNSAPPGTDILTFH